MFVVTYLDTATGLYNAEPFFEEEGAQGSVEAHKQFEDRYKEIKIREMTKEQFDELESEDFYDEFVTKGTIPGIETSGEEDEEMNLKEAFEEMAKVDIAPVEDTEVFVDGNIVKEDEPTVDGTPSGPEEGTDTTIANLIIKAINGEWETIDEYNSLVSALHQANLEEFIPVIEDITNEEHKHIGQLQECLKKISPNTESIESGEQEGAEQLKENLEMPKLKLNESMEDLDELVEDKELCAHADIPLRIATDWIFRKKLQKQHNELFKDKDKKLAEFIKKQDNREPKLELKESLFEATNVRSMKRKAIKEALAKINSMKKSLKESNGQSYYADGYDALQEVIEYAKDMLEEDGIDEAVRNAIDNHLIYTDDIIALCAYYGVIDKSEVINDMYELLYNDVYSAVSKYAEEQGEETQEESFRGIKPRKRLRESAEDTSALKEIFDNLKNGVVYGEDAEGPRWDYFREVLWMGTERNGKNIIFWSHYGSSANPATLKDLKWIIETIFHTTPSDFLKKYITKDKSKNLDAYKRMDRLVGKGVNHGVEESIRSRHSHRKGKALRESDEVLVFTQTPDEDVYVDFGDYVGDALSMEGIVIAGNRDFKEFGDDKLIKIVKGNYEGDENWNEDEQYYEDYDVLEMLKKVTGKDYVKGTMRGYSQSDWQNIYYPKGDESFAEEAEMVYMGKYDEFCNDEEGCIVVPHDVSWKGKEAIRKYIAKEIGDRPENIKVRMFTGYSRTANYDESLTEDKKGREYVAGIKKADGSTYALVGANFDNLNPFTIYIGGTQVGKSYATLAGAERELKRLLGLPTFAGATPIMKTSQQISDEGHGADADTTRHYYKTGRYSITDSLTEAKNSTDKFTAVYDELVSSKAGKTPFRKLKNKEEDRYDYTQVTYDDDGIIVRADSEEELDFAKEVAKAWNCETVVKNDKTMKHPFGLVLKVDEKEKVSK